MDYLLTILMVLLHPGCQKENLAMDNWAGNYTVTQVCDGAANPSYSIEVRHGAEDSTRLHLDNLGGYGSKVAATLQNDSLIIAPTAVNAGLIGKVELQGDGTREPESLLINLTVKVPGPNGTTTTSHCQLRAVPERK